MSDKEQRRIAEKVGPFEVFECACGCGARVHVSDIQLAIQPNAKWYFAGHDSAQGIVTVDIVSREPPPGAQPEWTPSSTPTPIVGLERALEVLGGKKP